VSVATLLRIRSGLRLAFPFILMVLMLSAQGMAVKDAHLGLRSTGKKSRLQSAKSTRPFAKITGRTGICMQSVRKEGYPRAEVAKAALYTDPWIRILPALPCHRNAATLPGNQSGTELPR
jgi:hypothetical protein